MARLLEVGYRMSCMPRRWATAPHEWHSDLSRAGCERGFYAKYTRRRRPRTWSTTWCATRTIPPRSSPASRRRGQCARGAHRADRRDVGAHQRDLAARAASRPAPDRRRASSPRFLDWVKERSQLLRRRLLRHHAAQRRLFLHAARHLPGARRQYGAHPRREIPRAAARRTRRSAAASTITNGRRSCAPSRRCAPITGSIRPAEALAGGGASDPAAGDAALAAQLLRRDHALSRPASPMPMAASAASATASPASIMRAALRATSRTSSRRACTSS